MPLIALTRPVPPTLADCQLTHLPRQSINLQRVLAQHAAYEETLRSLGAEILQLPAAADLPDSVFIEDTAIILDELAIITRPGAPSRRPETPAVAAALAEFRTLVHLRDPATLDGGDVLLIPQTRTLYTGLSSRTNEAGIEQLRTLTKPHGYQVIAIPMRDCLHLKSAATQIAPLNEPPFLLINPHWLPPGTFHDLHTLPIHPSEPYAANALRIGDALLHPTQFSLTRHLLHTHGIPVTPTDNDELAKAEGALTCCSLIFESPD